MNFYYKIPIQEQVYLREMLIGLKVLMKSIIFCEVYCIC